MLALYPGSVDGAVFEFRLGEARQGFGGAGFVAFAEAADGAEKAVWGLLVADGGAELHHGLVVVAWANLQNRR